MLQIIFLLFAVVSACPGQVHVVPYTERFDSVIPPALPAGWQTTTERLASGDFATTRSVPYSDSNAVISANAAIQQWLTTPPLDFSSLSPESLIFFERRSASHNSGILVEGSLDGGLTFDIPFSDTLRNPTTTNYTRRAVPLPSILTDHADVRIRWRVCGDGTGTTGTVRFDDISVRGLRQFDAAAGSMSFSPALPLPGDTISLLCQIINKGTRPLGSIPVELYSDLNSDSLAESSELAGSGATGGTIAPGESTAVRFFPGPVSSGRHSYICIVRLGGDQDRSNDVRFGSVEVGMLSHTIVINEIMFDPLAGDAEYIELYNAGIDPVDMKDWRLSDASDTGAVSSTRISTSDRWIEPHSYLVVAGDSAIFRRFPRLLTGTVPVFVRKSGLGLNNDEDGVILTDKYKRTIDSTHYLASWHNPDIADPKGRSLERINPLLSSTSGWNWGTCADASGGTPGRRNSIEADRVVPASAVAANPNPFSPDLDGIEDVTMISYRIPESSGLLRLRIYDSAGRLVRTLADGDPTGSTGERIWNGMDDRGMRVRIGIYIILLEATAPDSDQTFISKGLVVVAARM